MHNFKHWEMWLQQVEEGVVILLPCLRFKRVNYDSSPWRAFAQGQLCINRRREVVCSFKIQSETSSSTSHWCSISVQLSVQNKVVYGVFILHTHSAGMHLCPALTRGIRADNRSSRQNTWIAARETFKEGKRNRWCLMIFTLFQRMQSLQKNCLDTVF